MLEMAQRARLLPLEMRGRYGFLVFSVDALRYDRICSMNRGFSEMMSCH